MRRVVPSLSESRRRWIQRQQNGERKRGVREDAPAFDRRDDRSVRSFPIHLRRKITLSRAEARFATLGRVLLMLLPGPSARPRCEGDLEAELPSEPKERARALLADEAPFLLEPLGEEVLGVEAFGVSPGRVSVSHATRRVKRRKRSSNALPSLARLSKDIASRTASSCAASPAPVMEASGIRNGERGRRRGRAARSRRTTSPRRPSGPRGARSSPSRTPLPSGRA